MFSEDEYRLDFFVDEGFQRKKCEQMRQILLDQGRREKDLRGPALRSLHLHRLAHIQARAQSG